MHVLAFARAQPIERTQNKLETEIKQNADEVGTGDLCGTCSKSKPELTSAFCFISVPNLFCILSIGCEMASTTIYIIY